MEFLAQRPAGSPQVLPLLCRIFSRKMADKLQIERKGTYDVVTINNAKRGNSFDTAMLKKFAQYFTDLRRNTEVRVVILKGEGDKAFCTGLDMKESAMKTIKVMGKPEALTTAFDTQLDWGDCVRAMRACPQPIVACVSGLTMGGGFSLALASDIRLVTANVRMNVQMISIGLSGADLGVSYFLPRLVGMSHASKLMYTGEPIGAQEALRVGLVSEVFETADDMSAGAEKLCAQMLRAEPFGLRLTKHALSLSVDAPSLEAAMAVEDRQQVMLVSSPAFLKNLAKRRAKL